MYHKTVLDNGVRIISEQIDHLQSVALGIWVQIGSRDEIKSENGVSHFIEHMSFKGTRTRNSLQIAKELDAIGGLSNAFTGKENTCYHGRVLGKHFPRLADILSDISLNSKFEPHDMERERQVILQEISMVEDSPEDSIHLLFSDFFWLDHPVGMSVLGTGETVSSISEETIKKYIQGFYTPDRILVVAAGNVAHSLMVDHIKPLFGPLQGHNGHYERNAPVTHPGISIHFKDLEQVNICLGGEAASQTSENRFACATLNTILGGNMSSRLFQEIRENRGLAYSVYSFVSSYEDTGVLGVYVATDAQNVNPVLETVQKEIIKITRGELSGSDLEEAKEHLIGGIYLAAESAENRMMRLAKNEIIFERYVSQEELISNLERVSVDEVIQVAEDIFRNGNVSLVTLGPLEEADLDLNAVQFD
jgi:predicted Zn-dependent peptidase